ncbi:MAG: hypothetical protein DRI34_00920 [Deltaproteobacteria bacterium]|nr:MAG: hypothetical protein DRI34_00920 [Deltaproteobacteria bacterium]
MKTVNLLTLALLLAAAGMTARAAEVEPLEMQRAMRRAGLSKQQIRRIGELSLQADRQKLDIQKDLDLARLRLQQLLDADRPDRQAIMRQVEKVGRLETRLRQNRIDLLLDIRALMTAEQWRQLELFHFLRRQAGSGRRRP